MGISDGTGNEPRNLFNLVQFLMYDKNFSGKISVEQTLQILFVRHDRGGLDAEIAEIFGDQQKGPDGQEVKINFTQFLTKANAPHENAMAEKGSHQGSNLDEKEIEIVVLEHACRELK